MRQRTTLRRRSARIPAIAGVAALATIGAAACLDTTTEPLPEFDPRVTADRLAATLGPLFASENAIAGVEAVAASLIEHSGGAAAAMLPVRAAPVRPLAGEGLRAASAARTRMAAVRAAVDAGVFSVEIPAGLAARTLVWDTADDRYVVDPDATGAPADGVRYVHYEMDGFSRPVEPLVVLGTIDVTDEDGEAGERLAVRVVEVAGTASDTVLAYDVAMTGSFAESQGNLDYAATGRLSDGVTPVDFELYETFTWSQIQDQETLSARYIYAADAVVDFLMEGVSTFEAPEWQSLAFAAQVEEDGSAVEVHAALPSGGSVDGRILVENRVVVWIGGTDGAPAFAHAEGVELTDAELDALADIWTALFELVVWSDALVAPLAEVLLLPD